MQATIEMYVFGQFAASRKTKIPELNNPENIRSVCCIVSDRDIVLSQNGLITGKTSDIHINRSTLDITEYSSKEFSGHPQALLDKRVLSLDEYSAFLGVFRYEDEDHLIFVREAALRLVFEKDMIFSVENIQTVRIKDGFSDPFLSSSLSEVY